MSKKWVKIWAILALFWILIWVVWTWALIIFWGNSEQELTPEDYQKFQELIKQQQEQQINDTNTWSIETEVIEVLTWATSTGTTEEATLSGTTSTWTIETEVTPVDLSETK